MSIPSRVYIQNFPRNITTEQLKSILQRHASVKEISKSKNKGKKAKPFAYVQVRSQDDLERLLEAQVIIRGHHLNIKEYRSEQELKAFRHSEIKKRVFINNIPLGTEEEAVRRALERFGDIKILKMSEKDDSLTARITFISQEARDLCLTKGRIQLSPGTSVTVEEQRIYERREDLDSFERIPELMNRRVPNRGNASLLHIPNGQRSDNRQRISNRALQAPQRRQSPYQGTTSLQNFELAQNSWFSKDRTKLFKTRKLLLKENGNPVKYDHSQYRYNQRPSTRFTPVFGHFRALGYSYGYGSKQQSLAVKRTTSESQTHQDKFIHSR